MASQSASHCAEEPRPEAARENLYLRVRKGGSHGNPAGDHSPALQDSVMPAERAARVVSLA